MIKIELVTGSAISVMAEEDFRRKFRNQKLKTADITLRTYLGEHIRSDGYLDVQVDMVAPNRHFRYTYVKREDQLFIVGIG